MSKKWDTKLTIQFLEVYEENPCLWDVSSSHYKNRDLREKAYTNISKAMAIEGFESVAVKAKIRSIRNAYALERLKIQKSKTSGKGTDELYKPKVGWFPTADRILHDVVQSRESQSTEILENEETQRKESQSTNLDYTDDDEVMSPPANPTIPPTPKMPTTNRKPATLIAPKRMKIGQTTGKQSHTDKAIQELRELSEKLDTPADNNNEFDCFEKYIAYHLQKLPEHLALESMAFIQSYLVQQRLKNNTNNSQQIVHSEESRAHSAASTYEYSDYTTTSSTGSPLSVDINNQSHSVLVHCDGDGNGPLSAKITSNNTYTQSNDFLSQAVASLLEFSNPE